MRIIKKINNNVAVALDSNGNEIVVFGRGVGFGILPYELPDLSQIDRTFYNVDSRFYKLLQVIPESTILLVSLLIDQIKQQTKLTLNPNLTFVLADHINFTLERSRKGLKVTIPYSYELEYEHPELIEQARWFVDVINDKFQVELDDSEVSIIAMHFLNAIVSQIDTDEDVIPQKEINEIAREITTIIENYFNIQLNKTSFHYLRFKNHIKYLLQRKRKGVELAEKGEELYKNITESYQEIYKCVLRIEDYLETKFGKPSSHEELMYLMIHVSVLCEKEI